MKIITYLCTIKLKITIMKKIFDYSVLISIALLIIAFGLYLVYFMIKDNVYLNIIAIPFVFVVITLLESVLFFIICIKFDKNNPEIFILLYIVLSSLFHNQMNAVRQSIAVYFVTLSILYLIDKRWKEFVLLIVIAFTFHNSVLLFILLLPSFFLSTNCMHYVYLASYLINHNIFHIFYMWKGGNYEGLCY